MVLPNNEEWTTWNFTTRCSAGHQRGVYPKNQFARNPSVGLTTEDIWNVGGVLQFLSSAETMSVVSTSANDDGSPAGTGAQTVKLLGVDNNYTPIEEVIVLNGLTPVVSVTSFLRINRMEIVDVGSGGINAGTITATSSVSATVQCEITAEEGSSFKSQITIPDGYYGILQTLSVSAGTLSSASLTLQTRNEGGAWKSKYVMDFIGVIYEENLTSSVILSPHSDLRIQATRITGASDIVVTSFLDFFIIDADLINPNIPILGF